MIISYVFCMSFISITDGVVTCHCTDGVATCHCTDGVATCHCTDRVPTCHCTDEYQHVTVQMSTNMSLYRWSGNMSLYRWSGNMPLYSEHCAQRPLKGQEVRSKPTRIASTPDTVISTDFVCPLHARYICTKQVPLYKICVM